MTKFANPPFRTIHTRTFTGNPVWVEPYPVPKTKLFVGGEDMIPSLTFPKEKIVMALRRNRKEHLAIVQEAQKGYREELCKLLEKKLKDLKAGKTVDPSINMVVPANHVDDYDRAIAMLEMSSEKKITLSEEAFQCYVRNKWHWESHFLASNSTYSSRARLMFSRVDNE